MSERTYPCCKCCQDVALDDHVGHGGSVEKDGHDGPCFLIGCEKYRFPVVRPADRSGEQGEGS